MRNFCLYVTLLKDLVTDFDDFSMKTRVVNKTSVSLVLLIKWK